MNAIVVGVGISVPCALLAWALAAYSRRLKQPVVDMRMGVGGVIVPVLIVAAIAGLLIALAGAISLVVG